MLRSIFTLATFAVLSPLHAAELEVAGLKFSGDAWKAAETARPMSAGSLLIEGDAKREAIFYHFAGGQGGDVEMNLKRWTGQFAADPAPKLDRETVTAGGKEITIATITGTYKGSATRPEPVPRENHVMLAAIVPGPEGNVFIRMTAAKEAADAAKAEFKALAGSPYAAK